MKLKSVNIPSLEKEIFPKVSIIIPVYNSAGFLERTIKSALEQTYEPKEIIIVDDGSADISLQIARQYEGENVKVVQQSNAGACMARNTGLSYATGTYIQFLDAGDLLSKTKIEEQVSALAGSMDKLAVCNYFQFETDADLQNPVYPDQTGFIFSSNDPLDFLVMLWGGKGESNFIQTNSWLVPRKLIDKAGGWRNYKCPDDDGEFFARVILACTGIVFVKAVYNYYHIEPCEANQLSRNSNRKYLQNTLLTIGLKHKYLLQKGSHPLLNKAIATQYFQFAVYMFPAQKILSAIAYRHYKALHVKIKTPQLGGKTIELINTFFGWKTAMLSRYYIRNKWARIKSSL